MRKILMLLSIALLFSGCFKKQQLPDPVCKAVFKVTTASANIIATALQCENPGAIAGDLSARIIGLGLCAETAQQSTLTDLVCPQLSALVAAMATSPIPASWQCSASVVTDMIKSQIETTCAKVVK